MGFAWLAYSAQPATSLPLAQLLRYGKVPGYLAAAILAIGIAPMTRVMIPVNFRLIEINEKIGGARSQRSAKESKGQGSGRSAEESVKGEGQVNEFEDLSGPQERTGRESTKAEDEEVKDLLGKFARLNAVRAGFIAAGGIVGLATALG